MKNIKCSICGRLVKYREYIDHFRECSKSKNTTSASPDSGEEDEHPPKRQKLSGDSGKSASIDPGYITESIDNAAIATYSPANTNGGNSYPTNKLMCSTCGIQFTRTFNLKRHEQSCSIPKLRKSSQTACTKCYKTFSTYSSRLRHERVCQIVNGTPQKTSSFRCCQCSESFPSVSSLRTHERDSNHNRPGGSGISKTKKNQESNESTNFRLTCHQCGDRFANHRIFYDHRMMKHKQTGTGELQSDPWTANDSNAPWEKEDGSENESMRRAYEQHRHLILRERVREGQVRDTYNFPVANILNVDQLLNQIDIIYNRSQNAFKINLSFGLILQNVETEEYRYFAPYYNYGVLLFPHLISNRNDIAKLRLKLSSLDLTNYIQKEKPNSKWRPIVITNVLYDVNKTGFPLGLSKPLPRYISKSKSLVNFEKNPNTRKHYDDNRCFFRSLAYHRIATIYCERLSSELHGQWIDYAKTKKIRSTDVTLDRMPDLETCFEVNINVYELSEDNIVTVVYRSREVYSGKVVSLNLYEDHLSYIKRFNCYAKKFQCRLCDKLFDQKTHLSRHEKVCENITKLSFPGGYFSKPKTIFDKLGNLGINVDPELQYYPWFITFDLEAMLKNVDSQQPDQLSKTQLHQPISVSVCSNVEDFEQPKFILDPDQDTLLSKMIAYLSSISEKAYSLGTERWAQVFASLNRLETEWSKTDINLDNGGNNDDNDAAADDEDDEDDNDANDGYNGVEAMESSACEPPSEEFLRAMGNENVYYRFLHNLEYQKKFRVDYNDWDAAENVDNHHHDTSDNSSSSSCSSSDYEEEEEEEEEDEEAEDEEEEEEDICILPFRPLNPPPQSDDDDDNDDDDDDDDDDDIRPSRLANLSQQIESDDDGTLLSSSSSQVSCTEEYRTFPQSSTLMAKLIRRTREQFELYCHQIPVIGFNSAKYDLNLLKTRFAKHLRLHEPNQQKFVVKKNNAYTCLSTPDFRFLDMTNFLPPGTSYDKFLETFGVSQRKSYFPYEYFTNESVLEERVIPPKEAFFSSLKQCNVLEDPARVKYDNLRVKENYTETEALKLLHLTEPPRSLIDERYQSLLDVWEEENMETFRDFLKYYNNLDTLPMVEGIDKFRNIFVEKGVDVFKDCISVPGAARIELYKSGLQRGAHFPLIFKFDKDLYHTIKSNIVGGPSIIFTRHHEAGQTFIRDNQDYPCRSIQGYDANALYLHCIGQPMPCEMYIRRKRESGFYPQNTSLRYTSMFDWMEWLNNDSNTYIRHKLNNHNEVRIGVYLTDGYDNTTNTVYEFLGCYFHGHDCKDRTKDQIEKYNLTMERIEFIKSRGYKVEFIWECDYRKLLKENADMREFVTQRYPSFYQKHRKTVTEPQIIDALVSDTLFGFVEVDISVPESWEEVDYKPTTELSPTEYFSEMCPLFCTTSVPFESIGEHMTAHAKKFGLSDKPRTLLIGGMKAENLVFATPLLKWYIQHGLRVSKIHQVIEFKKSSCFNDFAEQITRDRRKGDSDRSQELRGSLSKLVGNSAFGGTIINQEKFQKVKYVNGFRKTCLAVNNPRFKQLSELGDDIFECEFANAFISINSPIYLGYMILQYAKLHILSFYYDCLDRFVGRENFEMLEMDTDSCYFALASDSLKDSIKPNMLQIFNDALYNNCTDDFSGDNFGNIWFPRECCQKHAKYDARTTGLMKLEFKGTRMIGLCSKSYITVNTQDDFTTNVKYSLKGVNKHFTNPISQFENVLAGEKSITSLNRGIRTFDNSVFTYTQPKQAFSYFYCKRVVQPDGNHTLPLNITLKPINIRKIEDEQKLEEIVQSLNIE